MDLYMNAVEQAADTWTQVRKIPRYELVVGKALFRHIFALAPQALDLYSFGEMLKGTNIRSGVSPVGVAPEELYQSPSFQQHAMGVVSTLGSAIMMMTGDGLSNLAESLTTLGARHVSYGVLPAHYQVLETALLRTLREIVGEELWSETARKGWAAVFKFIGQAMQAGAGSQVEILKGNRKTVEAVQASPSDVLRMKIRSTQSASCHSVRPRQEQAAQPLVMPSWPVSEKSIDTSAHSVPRYVHPDPVLPRLLQRKGDDTTSAISSSDSPPILPRRQPDTVHTCSSTPPTLPKRTTDENENKDNPESLHNDSTTCTVSETSEDAEHKNLS